VEFEAPRARREAVKREGGGRPESGDRRREKSEVRSWEWRTGERWRRRVRDVREDYRFIENPWQAGSAGCGGTDRSMFYASWR
jgi:hypothetical protein